MKDVDILDDMRVSKLLAKFFLKVNYSFKEFEHLNRHNEITAVQPYDKQNCNKDN